MAAHVLASRWRSRGCRASAAAPLIRSTIAALSSGRLPSAVAVIRVSGPHAFPALAALLGEVAPPRPRKAGLRRLLHPVNGSVLDRALVLRFPGPASATGEDVVELHCHGSPAVVAAVLDALATHGVQAAQPGEFTRRAFDAGRLDLTQVEGLADLLAATTEAQRLQAAAQADGALRRAAEGWSTRLVDLLASIEANLDFADEADTASSTVDQTELAAIAAEIGSTLDGFAAGERIREGIACAIIGAPNAGKSSLFNALLGRDAAIVGPAPGTTRDLIEAEILVGGTPLTLVDTAGLRETTDPIEAEGARRARARAATAEIVLAVSADGGWPDAPDGALRVRNKADLLGDRVPVDPAVLFASARTGSGLPAIRSALAERVAGLTAGGEPRLVTRGRQRDLLAQAVAVLRSAGEEAAPELMAEGLRSALAALESLAGRHDVEQILDAIFSRFCIGK